MSDRLFQNRLASHFNGSHGAPKYHPSASTTSGCSPNPTTDSKEIYVGHNHIFRSSKNYYGENHYGSEDRIAAKPSLKIFRTVCFSKTLRILASVLRAPSVLATNVKEISFPKDLPAQAGNFLLISSASLEMHFVQKNNSPKILFYILGTLDHVCAQEVCANIGGES